MPTLPSLEDRLLAAQIAYHNLMTGKSVREAVDQNGERVTYTAANADKLKAYIADLQAQIDAQTNPRSRGPITVRF